MSLTGWPLLMLLGVVTLVIPAGLAVVWSRPLRPGRRLPRAIARAGGLIACQMLAATTLFVAVNDQYAFYSSWADLVGVPSSSPPPITTTGLASVAGPGRLQVLKVSSSANPNHQLLVWYPPQYDQRSYAKRRFPVMMVLPGQPSRPETMFKHFDFGAVAAAEIAARRVPPFVAVFPPLMTNPPRDTECTDVPGGPQAFRWLSHDVPAAVTAQTRTLPLGRSWSVLGWSTGGFCAAKLLLTPGSGYAAAASLGGYYSPLTDHTTGNLFGNNPAVRDRNSPLWLYRQHGLPAPLLLVSGRQDRESWAPTQQFQQVARNDPRLSLLTFPTGGHNYRNYRDNLPAVIDWLATKTTP